MNRFIWFVTDWNWLRFVKNSKTFPTNPNLILSSWEIRSLSYRVLKTLVLDKPLLRMFHNIIFTIIILRNHMDIRDLVTYLKFIIKFITNLMKFVKTVEYQFCHILPQVPTKPQNFTWIGRRRCAKPINKYFVLQILTYLSLHHISDVSIALHASSAYITFDPGLIQIIQYVLSYWFSHQTINLFFL